ncbi:MAG TPA: hypothetical protein VFE78_19270 [Gemmataceae bacterium]|nr:hypothetical protein [Gemmataceae bacterium]
MIRRAVFLSLGVLEFLVALVLVGFAWQLPGPREVHDRVGRVERVSRDSSAQIQALREQVQSLRERRPQLQTLALRLQKQMRAVDADVKSRQVDYTTVRTIHDSLGEVAMGLDGLSQVLDPDGAGQLGKGLGTAADYLDQKVAPSAARAADGLEKATAGLRADALRLSALLRAAPLDLKAAREVHDSLGRFSDGLTHLDGLLKAKNAATVREGLKGLEESLNSGAGEVERVSAYTYPVVTFNGLKPMVDQKPFWPEGEKIGAGLRKAAKGVEAAVKEWDGLNEGLPKLNEALEGSRRAALATREALGTALKQQEKVEPLLKDVPESAARLAEELPRLGEELSKVLRDTARLKEVAVVLRQAQKAIDNAVAKWPQLRQGLNKSATVLREAQKQLQYALDHRSEYEASMEQTLLLSRTFASALPLLTEQLEAELQAQEDSLTHLGAGIDEVSAVLPACSDSAAHILQTTRLLLALVALVFGVHGLYLIVDARPPAR